MNTKTWGDVIRAGLNGEYGDKWIKAAAIIVNGKIRYHARHHLILKNVDNANSMLRRFGPYSELEIGEQGFMLQDGSFIGRVEALELAKQNGQLLNPLKNGDRLFSEDLWCYSEI